MAKRKSVSPSGDEFLARPLELSKPIQYSRRTIELIAELERNPKSEALMEELYAEFDKFEDEQTRRLYLLMEFHELDHRKIDGWIKLARLLGEQLIPGLRGTYGTPGAKKKWTAMDRAQVRIEIDDLRAKKPGLSISSAAAVLSRSPKWKDRGSPRGRAEVLRRAYYEADPKFVDAVRKRVHNPFPQEK